MPAPDYAAEIAALEAALGSGELKVMQDGELVEFASAADILARIRYFEAKAGTAATPTSARGQFGFSAPRFVRD